MECTGGGISVTSCMSHLKWLSLTIDCGFRFELSDHPTVPEFQRKQPREFNDFTEWISSEVTGACNATSYTVIVPQ